MAVVSYYKKYTETLSVMLNRFRMEYPEYANSKLTYAGRLDPLAEGLMVILTDDDVHRKEEYLSFPKTYEVDMVFGVSTDTYDILGIPQKGKQEEITTKTLENILADMVGRHTQAYPPYSSRTVEGKPLYQWSREGRLSEISLPRQEIEVTEVQLHMVSTISSSELLKKIQYVTLNVEGDFRQQEILSAWKQLLSINQGAVLNTATFSFSVSSGTYIRGLVEMIGRTIGTGACCISIRRIGIGDIRV